MNSPTQSAELDNESGATSPELDNASHATSPYFDEDSQDDILDEVHDGEIIKILNDCTEEVHQTDDYFYMCQFCPMGKSRKPRNIILKGVPYEYMDI